MAELTDLIAERLADAHAENSWPPKGTVAAEIVARSVADVRSRELAAGRRHLREAEMQHAARSRRPS
ncbi:hypothetical protein ACFVVA_41195 [Kitasatospora sp. NPDC058048]|uniref:hypothetical protein n=1 Tax=Kitasatospora sp. NPDC058048 TaxID=3346313 RepID=UPI0036D84ED6